MTSFRAHNVCCPNCGTEKGYQRFDSVNVTLHPELQEKMDTLELFTWSCPKCGNKYILKYPFLYHDMEQGIMELLSINYSKDLEAKGYSGIIEI